MIKPEELRIGNLVLRKEIQTTVTSYGLVSHDKGLESLYEPIPLTEQWLKKLGFRHSDNGIVYWFPLTNLKAELHMEVYSINTVPIILSDFAELILDEITNVHSLQNLIFSLTGMELTIKE